MNPRLRDIEPDAVVARTWIRAGEWTKPTAGLAPGFVQANLVIVASEIADDVEAYCRANPRALPLLERTATGSPVPARLAPSADLRTDLPRYRVFRDGRVIEEPAEVMTLWHDDFVAFLLGCSFTFDGLIAAHRIPVRHVELGRNVPMYITNRATEPAGVFSGPLVVSMRPIARDAVEHVVRLTRSLPLAHGEPIHIGTPEKLGIESIEVPTYGDPVPIAQDEVPVFWPCGVTAQAAIEHSRIPFAITHAPGHMFITDLPWRAGDRPIERGSANEYRHPPKEAS